LEAMFQASIRLPWLKKILGLYKVNLSSVERGLFASALSRLQVVDLQRQPGQLTADQVQALFQALAHNCQQKKLALNSIILSSVEPELLAI